MRCLTLAELLQGRGADARFVCRAHGGNLNELLHERKFPVSALPSPRSATISAIDGDYATWLGVAQGEDAEQTIAVLEDSRPDWLIVDHYGLDAVWERLMRPHAHRLMVISDLANRPHDCDVLLNQNYYNEVLEQYAGLVPDGCRLMLGPRYALLRPEFEQRRRTKEKRDGRVRRVFVFFGGTDQGDVTGLALDALCDPEFAALEVDVVVGANNARRQTLEKKISTRQRTRLYGRMPRLAELMAEADLAIGAGGGTTWERMCVGVPSVVVSIAENQEPACKALSESGLIRYLGPDSHVGTRVIRDELRKCLAEPASLAEISARGQLMVDGLGAGRIAEFLDPTPAQSLRLRPANAGDAGHYFHWVNDPVVRRQSLRSEPIDFAEHQSWFAKKVAARQTRLFVMEAGELPVGQIRFDREGAETRIDYSIDPLFRGRGWAKSALALGLQEMRREGATIFRADVKESNPVSCAVFRKLGFSESSSTAGSGIRVFRLDATARRREA